MNKNFSAFVKLGFFSALVVKIGKFYAKNTPNHSF